jgi:hypothetical protein
VTELGRDPAAHALALEGSANFRDLGGWPVASGGAADSALAALTARMIE